MTRFPRFVPFWGLGIFIGAYLSVSAVPRRSDDQMQCTARALAAVKLVPELKYECEDRDEDNFKSPDRKRVIDEYRRHLESFYNDANWWSVPVEELNSCDITHEVRALTKSEIQSYYEQVHLYGDTRTRLVANVDPCIKYSYSTLNAFFLVRDGSNVAATQVLDGFYTRFDYALDLEIAQHNGQRILLLETHTADGMMPPMPYSTFYAFVIDPNTHRTVPTKIFREAGKLSNQFRFDAYLFDNEKLANQWKAPRMVLNGKLAPRFQVLTLSGKHFNRTNYLWNGSFFAAAGK